MKITIKLPSFGKEKKTKIETIRFSEIKNYMEELRNKKEISEYYEKLKKYYENFMDKLHDVERGLEVLENEGEKTFTFAVRKKLEKIEELKEFDVSSFQEFYTNTFHIIDRIVKISPRTQHQVLKYKNGKETIEVLNSFLEKLQDLKKVLAKRYSEYSVVNHFENALKKQKEIGELKKKIVDAEKKIKSTMKQKENTEGLLEEKIKHFENIKSKLNRDKIKKLKNQINSLNKKIKTIDSDLKVNLLRARRPISKILHSSDNKKIFNFFQEKFMKYPLENINEEFWQMVNILKKESINLCESENENLNDFLRFVENELKDKFHGYKNLEAEKRKLEEVLEELSSENKELLKKAEDKKEQLKKEFNITKRRLKRFEEKKNRLESKIRKDIKTLEIMLSKASKNKIRIEI